MTFARWMRAALACFLAASIDACGPGDDRRAGIEGTGRSDDIDGTGSSDGTASGFGSVFVNGVEFDTSGAEIVIDGQPATEEALQVGMVLRVTGTFAGDGVHGTARRVAFDRRLAGPVEEVALEEKRVTALGQTLRVDAQTVFVDTSLETLRPQDAVVVSGFMGAGDETLATRVQRIPAPSPTSPVEIEGIVRDLAMSTCRVGNLTVDYTASFLLGGVRLSNGAFIEALGYQLAPGGTLYATRIAIKDPVVAPPGQLAEISGLVSEFRGLEDFSVGGQRVDASRAVRTDDAAITAANDVRIEIEGLIDENGRLVAESFALRPPSDVRLSGSVDSVDTVDERFVVGGSEVATDPSTQYEDESSAELRTFRVDDLRSGDTVDVRGFRDADGGIVATRIIRLVASAP